MLQDTRDVLIIIFSTVGTLYFLTLLVSIIFLGKKVKAVTDSASKSLAELQKIIEEIKVAIKPIMQLAGFLEAAGKGIELASRLFGKNKGGKKNE